MSGFKLLIDTNVLIGLEDAQPVQASLSEFVRLCGENGVSLFVDGANYDDVQRDPNIARRAVTLSKLEKFPRLRDVPPHYYSKLVAQSGSIKNKNDEADMRLLSAVEAKAVDFLVSQDIGLHRRAARASLNGQVLTVEAALNWVRQLFTPKTVSLPYVVERKAYEIDHTDPIFDSLRSDYPGFDVWFAKCKKEHRDCWVLEVDGSVAGIAIRKEETPIQAGTLGIGPKILKICTLKVGDQFQGEKFGELLLKQILWFAQRNAYNLVYLTVFPKHAFLIELLQYYGFEQTKLLDDGEVMLEKKIANGPLPPLTGDAFDFDRVYYPRFENSERIRKFCVPIRPDYHRHLFPEIAFSAGLPLFPAEKFGLIRLSGQARTPGNTVRKVYLCRSNITRLRSGDLLFFYMSKDVRYALSQAITTVAVVEQVLQVVSTNDLIAQTAKRSAFSADELRKFDAEPGAPVKLINFLLIGHLEPPVPLKVLTDTGVFTNRPPQSITELTKEQYRRLKPNIKLGFEI
jgi:GNAT superfamily N-acetyltransferase